jgi:RNA polymerase sigma-54 factor
MYNGDTQTSTTSIKFKIKQLIENENDHILSDDAIVELLAAQSIKIARRTVAKYRDEMKIPTSAQRKREYRRINR